MTMVTGVKVFVVVGPNFRVKGVYSSYRLALATSIKEGKDVHNIETWVVDGNGTLENST
jgi:hypothetical protein